MTSHSPGTATLGWNLPSHAARVNGQGAHVQSSIRGAASGPGPCLPVSPPSPARVTKPITVCQNSAEHQVLIFCLLKLVPHRRPSPLFKKLIHFLNQSIAGIQC